jgi:hypothetical protein
VLYIFCIGTNVIYYPWNQFVSIIINMVFGRELPQPCLLLFGALPHKGQSAADYVADFVDRMFYILRK